jgi:ABC-type antimicrobial peptide transport system permease subunit
MTFAIRTAVPPLSISGAVRQAAADVDPTLPVAEMRTQEEQIRRSLATERMFATSVSAFGLVAAVLTAIGLYGLLAYTVGRRTAEIGIRIALGARRHQVQWLIIRETVGSVVVGLVIGVPAALALTRLAQSSLYEVHPSDPWSLGSALCVMIVVAAISAWLPARRASQVDPMNALRVE